MNIAQIYLTWRKEFQPEFSQAAFANEIGVHIRTVERWKAGGTPGRIATNLIESRIRAAARKFKVEKPGE